jgi:pilus assembly protein CpaE
MQVSPDQTPTMDRLMQDKENPSGLEADDVSILRSPRRQKSVVRVLIGGVADFGRDQIVAALEKMSEPDVELVARNDQKAQQHQGVIAIVVLSNHRENWALEIQEVRAGAGCSALIAATDTKSGEDIREAIRAGADDVIFLPAESTELSHCLIRVSELAHGEGAHHGMICAITSVAGGSGVSTLTASLGFASARLSGKRVVLVDLAAQSGILSALLDLNPEHTMAELIDPTTTPDSIHLKAALSMHNSGVYLLAAPRRIEQSEMISPATITPVLKILRELFDFIIVDCGHHMNETLVASWELANLLVYPVEQAVTSVRPARRFLEMFDHLSLSHLQPEFVLNKYDARNPFSLEKIEAALGRAMVLSIPRDDAAFIQMQIASTDLAMIAPKSPAAAAIDKYAHRLCGTPDKVVRPAPLFSRVRSVFGMRGRSWTASAGAGATNRVAAGITE